MRFMVLVKMNPKAESAGPPSRAALQEMNVFNDELIRDGVVLAYDGLHPSAKGARLRFGEGGTATVVDGPFTESKEIIAGYWMVELSSLQEAIERFSRAPFHGGEKLEIRKVYEPADFAPVAPPEMIAEEEQIRAQLANKR